VANEEHLRILRQGVDIWNRWRKEHPDIRPDLRVADLSEADLSEADLSGADLCEADLFGALLHEADLREALLREVDLREALLNWADLRLADLSGANLREAFLSGAKLNGAKLSGTDLIAADLSGADLGGVDLNGVNLSGAKVGWTVFGDVNLSVTKGLESVIHLGPSTMGIDTVYASQGQIPEVFLRGAGVPDEFITYMRSLVGRAIKFYSCFISYSSKDQEFAERLHADLQAKGVRCWFAPEDVQGGRKLHEQIEQAIRHYDKLLLVLSENSMNSEWVKTEIYHARQDEIRTQRRKLFPISLVNFQTVRAWTAFDADTGKDMGREVREYFIPDFSNWKDHDAYKVAFDRLLRDLKAEGQQAVDASNVQG
jgi:hypothetical protein